MLCSTATVLHRTDYGEHCGIWTTHPPPIPLEVVKLMREVLRTLLFTRHNAHTPWSSRNSRIIPREVALIDLEHIHAAT